MKNFNLIKRLWADSHEKQSPQRFGRYAAMLIMLLTLGVGQMWAASEGDTWRSPGSTSNAHVYFDNTNSSYSNVSMLVGRQWNYGGDGVGSWGINFSKVSGTNNLYYANVRANSYTTFCFIDATNWGWEGNKVTARCGYASHYTNTPNDDLGTSTHLYIPASGSNDASVTHTTPSSYTALNYTQTLNQTLSTDGGSTFSASTAAIATVKVQSKKLNGNSSTTDDSGTISSGSSSTSCAAARTATVTYSVASVATGYEFVGWYDGSTQKSTSTSYTYNALEDKTITARFKETQYSLTFSHNGHGTIKVGGSTISSGSTANVNYFTTKTLVATASTGYSFSGWTKSGSNTGSVTIGNTSNASTTIKATNTGATVTAGFSAKTYTITLDKNGADGSDGSATATYNSNSLTSVSHPTYTDYRCDGYYTGASSGTKIINSDGTLVASTSYTDASGNWTYDGNLKLYAHWTYDVTNYTVTYGVGTSYTSLGSLSAYNNSTSAALGASPQSVRSGHSVTFTASPNTGYTVEGWYTNAACNAGKHDAGSTTYTTSIGAATNVYVKFVEKTWTVSFANDGHGTTSPSSNQTVGQLTGVSISATPSTGYTFDTWTITSGSGSFTSSAGTPSNKFKPTANSTITASFNETMTTVTINANPTGAGTFTVGGAAFAAGNTTTAGVTTSRTVVATAANDYTFGSWSVTGNATGTYSTNTYTLKGNGSGSTGTLTANFTLVPCTLYYGGSTPLNSPSSEVMSYDPEEHAYYVDVTTTSDTYYFRFLRDSKEWSGDWNSYPDVNAVTVNGSKVDCATDVSSWGNKASLKYTGANGSKIRIWFDAYAKKAWITGSLDKQYVLRGSKYDNSGNGGMPGWDATDSYFVGLASGSSGTKTVTLAARVKYKLKAYDMFTATYKGKSTSGEQQMADNTYYAVGSGGDFYFTSTAAGPYTFTYHTSSGLKVKFPTSYQVNFSSETFVNGGASHSTSTTGGTLSAVDGNSSTFTSGSKIIEGGTVVITASKADGYTFNGFYTNAACTTAVSGAGVSISDNVLTLSSISAAKTVYAKFSENMTTVNLVASPASKGSFKVGGAAASSTTAGVTTTRSVQAVAGTGYHLTGTIWTKNNNYINLSSTTASTITVSGTGTTGNSTNLTATFTPNTYRVEFHRNGASQATVYQNFTYDVAQNLTANSYTRTGYNFAGWALAADAAVTYADGANVSNLTSTNEGTFHLYAKWTPKSCTVNFNFDESDPGYGSKTGATTSTTATYDAAMTSVTPPTAANGYAFMGFYDAADGAGNQYYDGTGASANNWNKDTEDDVTLYAYYKQAEIADLELSPASIAPNGTVTATPTISPLPEGTTCVCWKFLRNNGNPYPGVTFSSNPSSGNTAVTFTAPSVSGTYKVACVLRTGSVCGSGTVLDSIVANLVVAGEHTVTIQYQDGDGRALKDTIHTIGKPLEWSSSTISPATITGYTFARWEAGDGVFITDDGGTTTKTTTTTADIKIKANYEGTLTAVYTKKRMIYFYNTLGWGSVYVYFYKNDSYWQTVSPYNGSGANTSYTWTNIPYSEGKHGQMLPVSEGSNIYYFDAEAAGVNASYDDVVFTEHQQHGYDYFYETNAARRGDYKSSMPMFVPLADQTAEVHNRTNYYNSGYWMNYPENSGYTLKIYNGAYATKETAAVQSIAFPYSDDLKLPLKIDVELSDGYNHDYWFMVYRNDGTYMGGGYHFKQGYQDEQIITGGNSKEKITTSAPGNYTFILTYHGNGSGTNNYYIDVDFPIATGDYRIYYSDNATWSKGAHTKDSWHHPSHSIAKATDAKNDTVSFFISKGDGITHTMKFQKASVTNEGVVSWSDVDGGGITIPSSVEESGVYNFIVSQPAGGASIALEKVEPYTGNFYIRTDCAGNTKWDSFKNADHQMTYSDYAEANSGFSHYYAHWVTSGMNVKFVIANDYSMCISDTLIEDYGTTIANISNIGVLNSGNASIRFMWNQATNKISRAYISGSSNVADRFLVLEGDAKLYDENGNHYSISGLNANEVNLIDDENFVYERTIQVNATACAKLTAKYNDNVQYFKGGSGSTASDSVQLLGGTYNVDKKYPMRIVYDFKTNRLVTAYMPEGEIDGTVAINADMMLIREHQGEATQLTFANGDAKLTEVKTVYGVMRFNRWTLNNRQHPEDMNKDHSKTNDSISTYHPYVDPGDVKSVSERGLYWISFPFDVKLNDVFGLGTYGEHWIMMEYNGAARAKEGYWKDSEGFWEYIWNRNGVTLEKGKGYVLALELDLMQADNRTFWSNEIQQVELFFPSASSTTGSISQANVDVTVPSHLCTIDRRTDKSVADWNKDRRVADSHWNIIGVPSYANYNKTLTDGSSMITWHANPKTQDLPFLYEWNSSDNTYTVQSGTTYPFKAMHAYYVQYAGTLHWTLASATPSSIVARRTYADKPQNVEFQLQLQQNEKMIDQTFVKLSNDETASVNFSFGEDLNKEFNSGKANIYTFIENYIPAAGNTLPLTEQTTVVPMGVKIATTGDYTFSIPSGTNGVGVTLVDNETGIRTNLALMDYTIALEAGTQDDRFYLEISPIKHVATDIENTDAGDHVSNVRKMMVDGLLYIIKNGKVFDAHGARVK